MHAVSRASSPAPLRQRTPNPVTCLRPTAMPRCIVCGQPTLFNCARCPDGHYYCTPSHLIQVRVYRHLHRHKPELHVMFQDWPKHGPHCTGVQTSTWECLLNTISGPQYCMPTNAWDWTCDAANVVGLLAHPLMGGQVIFAPVYVS